MNQNWLTTGVENGRVYFSGHERISHEPVRKCSGFWWGRAFQNGRSRRFGQIWPSCYYRSDERDHKLQNDAGATEPSRGDIKITLDLQVSPAELESVIIRHAKVADVGVVGIPDAICGEVPRALVVPRDSSLTVEEIHEIVNGAEFPMMPCNENHSPSSYLPANLTEYKHLRGGVKFVSFIPKSPTGKIQRELLKKMWFVRCDSAQNGLTSKITNAFDAFKRFRSHQSVLDLITTPSPWHHVAIVSCFHAYEKWTTLKRMNV